MPSKGVKPRRGGTPEEHLRFMTRRALKWADGEGVAFAAEALLSALGSYRCPRQQDEPDCRPGACDCDGMHDALEYAIVRYRACVSSLSPDELEAARLRAMPWIAIPGWPQAD